MNVLISKCIFFVLRFWTFRMIFFWPTRWCFWKVKIKDFHLIRCKTLVYYILVLINLKFYKAKCWQIWVITIINQFMVEIAYHTNKFIYFFILRGCHTLMCCLCLTFIQYSKLSFSRINFILLVLILESIFLK